MPRYVAPTTPLARRLFQLRIERGWSQREAAERIGVTYSVVQRIEHGHRISPRNAYLVAEFWRLDPAIFFTEPAVEAAA